MRWLNWLLAPALDNTHARNGQPLLQTSLPLLRAMARQYAHDTRARREELYLAVLRSTLLLPVFGPAVSHTDWDWPWQIRHATTVQLEVPADAEGDYIVAYSDLHAIKLDRTEPTAHVCRPATQLAALVIDHGVNRLIVNPRGPLALDLRRDELLALFEHRLPDSTGRPPRITATERLPLFPVDG